MPGLTTKSARAVKRTGREWENKVAEVLSAALMRKVERRVRTGAKDQGDIVGVPGWTLECKAEKGMDLAGWLNEAKVEAGHAGTYLYAVVAKRRNHAPEHAYVILPLWAFARVLLGDGQLPGGEALDADPPS